MKKLFSTGLLLLLTLPLAFAAEPDPTALRAKNDLLKAEFELARQPLVYFHFELKAHRVLFKSRGIQLAELSVTEVQYWGALPAPQVRTLVSRTGGGDSKRPQLQVPSPGEERETQPLEAQAWELGDMPTAFTAVLDDGVRLRLRPAPQSWLGQLPATVDRLSWYLRQPLLSIWNSLRGKPYTEVRIVLQPQDVQRLYWSFVEQGRCLIGP